MNKIFLKITSGLLLCSFLSYTTPILAFSKEETVYSKVNANGESYKTIVSTHLINEDQEETLRDLSDLINIENTNGDETFELDGDNLTWSANGADIYYQGETQKELPIKCSIKYELDGKEISADEIAGRSGKVKIIINYENTDEHKVYVNGRYVSIYTPFTVICGTMFDNTRNKNIEVSSGKVVNDGTKTIVMGIVMPGMQESLNISKNTLDIPDSIEITLDTEKYEQKNIITFITPKILKEKVSFNKLNSLYSQIDEVQEASKKIEEGANGLKDGTTAFSQSSQKFLNGMKQLEEGANTASSKYEELNNGISKLNQSSTELKAGANAVDEGIDSVSQGLDTLNGGVISGKQQTVSVLNSSATTLSTGIDKIIEGKDTEIATIKQMVIKAPNAQLKEGLTEAVTDAITSASNTTKTNMMSVLSNEELNFTAEQKAAIINALGNGVDTKKLESQISNTIDSITAQQEAGLDQINNDENGVKAGLTQLKTEATKSITSGTEAIAAGFDSISYGVTQISNGTATLKAGTTKLYKGTEQLKEGTNALNEGSNQMQNGLKTLASSTTTLTELDSQLTDAAITINEGSIKLADGIKTFNTEAIDKIATYVNSDIKDLIKRAEKLQELSEEYASFTKAQEGTAKEVKFILITDSIKAKEEKEEN